MRTCFTIKACPHFVKRLKGSSQTKGYNYTKKSEYIEHKAILLLLNLKSKSEVVMKIWLERIAHLKIL